MNKTIQIIIGLAMILTVLWMIARFYIKRLYRATDPGDIIIKTILTAACFAFWIYLGVRAGAAGDYGSAFMIAGITAGTGIFLAILWAPHISDWVASPITNWFDGGDEQAELRPLYSIATAYRKRGNYEKSIAEIHRQLTNFPTDYEGWMMLAEVQALDLKDLDSAVETVNHLLTFENLHPKNAAFALGRVADWYLDQRQDRDGAREALERISALFPGSTEAHIAEQRIAHLASAEHLADQHDPHLIAIKHHDEKLGLMGRTIEAPAEVTPESKAGELVQHLQEFPLDNEAREKLAHVYAQDLKRLDLAALELEELITRPSQLPKQIAHWLNLLADFQMRLAGDVQAARATLKRIVDLFPKSALASNAETRISQLRLELNQRSNQRTVRLGSYDTNIGLRKMNSSGQME